MAKTPLPAHFFQRKAPTVARELLGKYLVRKSGGKTVAHMITEVEAYDGFEDKASHASRGKTPRNTPMFEAGGITYIYFTYGMHYLLNVVCGEEGYPSAVLLRGVEGIKGPARLTKALGIDKSLNARPLGKQLGLWIEDRGVVIPRNKIKTAPRIGVAYAGEKWAGKKWRYFIA